MRLMSNIYQNFIPITGNVNLVGAIAQALVKNQFVKKSSLMGSSFVTIKRQMTLFLEAGITVYSKAIDVTFVIGESVLNTSIKMMVKLNSSFMKQQYQGGNGSDPMNTTYKKFMILALVAMVGNSQVEAKGRPMLDIRIADQKINMTTDEQLKPEVVSYHPGDTLRYVITASNVGDDLMTDAAVVDPIPAGVTYIPNSETGENAEVSFSINQGNTFMAWPPYYTVRNAKGILIKRKATADMISHIKWNLAHDLKPTEKSDLEFLVVVN